MNRMLISGACFAFLASCSSYDYPSRELVVREGEPVLHFKLQNVRADSVDLKGPDGGLMPLKPGQRFSAGNNQHLKLTSTNLKLRQASFEHSWLEWHGGLVLSPF